VNFGLKIRKLSIEGKNLKLVRELWKGLRKSFSSIRVAIEAPTNHQKIQ